MRRAAIQVALAALALSVLAGAGLARPRLGAKVGLNAANWHGRDYADTDMRFAFSGGGHLALALTSTLWLQAEALYTMKGTHTTEGDTTTTAKLSYLELPLLLRFAPASDERVQPYLVIGPAVALELSSRIAVDGQEWDSEEVCMDTRSPDLGLVLGTGIQLVPASASWRALLEIRYVLGLTRINDSPRYCREFGQELGGPFDIKNRVITLGFGLEM